MSKYTRPYLHPPTSIRGIPAHPLWRGIGCILLILIPIISFAGAKYLVQANSRQGWIRIPAEMRRSLEVPILGPVYFVDLAVTILIIILAFGLITVVYALIYRLFGPPRYGPLDAHPD
jgi:hypothetical protein